MLYDQNIDRNNCGVGFITRKDGVQTHDLLKMGHQALCRVPHRGGMSSEGIGDGAGISIDLSLDFFQEITNSKLELDYFGVGNFFLPTKKKNKIIAENLINLTLKK